MKTSQTKDISFGFHGEGCKCPNCGMQSIIRLEGDRVACIACDFQKIISPLPVELPPKPKEEPAGLGLFFVAIALCILVLLYNAHPKTPEPSREINNGNSESVQK